MLEFPGQVLELSMPVWRGTKRPLGHLWVQALTDNDYLNLRALLRDIYDIIIQITFLSTLWNILGPVERKYFWDSCSYNLYKHN